MLKSFFPNPKWFFLSAVLWIALAVGLWYSFGRDFGRVVGLPPLDPKAPPIIGLSAFWTTQALWFYIYYTAFLGVFAAFWRVVSPHPWWRWSILGSALIIFVTYINVEFSVINNNWFGPFWDLIQKALNKANSVPPVAFYTPVFVLIKLGLVQVITNALNLFFVSHYIFRWRTAMNNFYVENWEHLRSIEGAAQRVQEDTMRFSMITEDLGVSLVQSVMTLIAFMPVLERLSAYVHDLPVIGYIPHPLVIIAIAWSAFGTIWLAVIGVKLPGLNFKNQRVEAAYRKELVYGEDHEDRATPVTLHQLFRNVRKNYFRLYFHYMYFNVGRAIYSQIDALFLIIVLGPTILAARITYGVLQQILGAFSQVSSSFQYLITSWSTIIELISIYKRLHAFEATLDEKPLNHIEAQPAV